MPPGAWCFFILLLGACTAQAQEEKLNVIHPLPQAPPWLEGYQVRWPVRVFGEPSVQTPKTVVVSLPTGGWLKPDASDLAVQSARGELLPAVVLSHDPAGETIVQFKRQNDDPWYWIYGVSATGKTGPRVDPKTDKDFHEGVSLEVRAWAGSDLSNWAKGREGLSKSDKVIGNAVVMEVVQNCNPARPGQPDNFVASYRGFLDIKKDGTYRFVVNADQASFLFIDGFKVFERAGKENQPFNGAMKVSELEKLSGKVDLKKGVHSFEVHQISGDKPQAQGVCVLLWSTPDQPKFKFLPPEAIAQPLYARTAAVERAGNVGVAFFQHGIEDVLESGGLKLYMVRFEAEGNFRDADKLRWDFGDGTTGKGHSIVHVYFKEGDYNVTLAAGEGVPPYRRHVHVWSEPVETSPLSLARAVQRLAELDWKKFDRERLRQIFLFLQVCQQPEAWPLMDAIAEHLLAGKDLDLEMRSQLYVSRIEALTRIGKANEALKLAEKAHPEFARTPALQVRLQLAVAALHQYHYKAAAAASKIYKAILDEHSRTEHPNLRLAAVRWGDLFAESGDLVRAAETYRLAGTLGGEKFAGTVTDASTRGALLRIAEQKFKGGEIQQTRQLLERLELEHPGRRLDGLYCFLHAETDRSVGRYEEALRSYEMIFKLPQWAGYRDRASLGIADTYLKMGDLEKARKWLADLQEAAPKFFEDHKGKELEKLLEEQVKQSKDGANVFKGFETGFEPDEDDWFGNPSRLTFVCAPGMKGPHAALLDSYPDPVAGFTLDRPAKNMTPGATYWVEVWYRDLFRSSPPVGHGEPNFNVQLFDEKRPQILAGAGYSLYRNAPNQWHKASVKIKAPLASDNLMRIQFGSFTGVYLFDRLSLRPVSDRQLDALVNFQEENKSP